MTRNNHHLLRLAILLLFGIVTGYVTYQAFMASKIPIHWPEKYCVATQTGTCR